MKEAFLIYGCGWAVGLLTLYWSAFRDWKEEQARKHAPTFRPLFSTPRGLVFLLILTFFIWWLILWATGMSIWIERGIKQDEEKERDE